MKFSLREMVLTYALISATIGLGITSYFLQREKTKQRRVSVHFSFSPDPKDDKTIGINKKGEAARSIFLFSIADEQLKREDQYYFMLTEADDDE